MTAIEAEALTTFELAPDGGRVRFHATDAAGAPVSFSLPADCLRQLVMTLPAVAQEAMRRQYRDPSLRIVYPVGSHAIEQGDTIGATFIVTMSTPDGFEVSFGFDPAELRKVGRSIEAAAASVVMPVQLN